MDVEWVVLEKPWASHKAGTEVLVDSVRAEMLVGEGFAKRGRKKPKAPKGTKAALKAEEGKPTLRVME